MNTIPKWVLFFLILCSIEVSGQRQSPSHPDTDEDSFYFGKLNVGKPAKNPATTSEVVRIPVRSIDAISKEFIIVDRKGSRVFTYSQLAERDTVVVEPYVLLPGKYKYALVVDGRVVKVRELTVVQ